MKKLEDIRTKCQEAANEFKELKNSDEDISIDAGRAELAEEILEILNGETK